MAMIRMLERLREMLRQWRPPDPEPIDPDAQVREPKRHGPGGRNAAAVALLEPEAADDVDAYGRPSSMPRKPTA